MQTARVESPGDIGQVLARGGLAPPLPTLVVVGGAGGVEAAELESLEPVCEALAALAERLGAAIVDGGTDVGIMRLLGRARARARLAFPLVGVVVEALVAPPGTDASSDRVPLEPNHSHVVLVPGREWGDETVWLARVGGALAGDARSATLLVNGGEIAYADAEASVDTGRPVLALAGSGRAADAVASAVRGLPADARAQAVAASPLVRAVELRDTSRGGLVAELERVLTGRT